jgi:ABC-2 type transport system permease protein
MKTLLSASLKMLIRDHQAIFWAFLFPMLFLGVFRLFSFDSYGTTNLIVAGETADVRSTALVDALGDVEFLEVTVRNDLPTVADVEAALSDEDGLDAALFLTDSAGPTLQAELIMAINDPIGSSVTVAAIRSVVDGVSAALTDAPRAIEMFTRSVDADGDSFFEFLGPGIIGMGLMSFATISLAGSLSRYREEGVLRRIRATPLAPSRFFVSVVAAHLVIAAGQVLLLALVAEVLGANILRGGIGFLLICILGTVIFLNLGVIIAGRVQGRGAVEGAANAITLPMMFLSGTFFPTSGMPAFIQPLVQALPLTHMLTALRGLTIRGETFVEQWPSLLVLTAWVIGTLVVARFAFSFRDA